MTFDEFVAGAVADCVEARWYPADGGLSTCPMCSREWTVTPAHDCLVPSCGCYGTDTSAANPHRPCERCGMRHAMSHLEEK